MSVKSLGKNAFKFEAKLLASKLNEEVLKEISKNQAKFKIAGFRQGKVPLDVIKQSVGDDFLLDAANKLARLEFIKYTEENKIKVLGTPRISFDSVVISGKDADVSVSYETYPEIKLPDFSKLKLSLSQAEVQESDVDSALENLQFKHAVWQEVSDKVSEKDRVEIDFTGKLDGEVFEGGSATNYKVELGQQKMLPDFESGIIGMKIGEEKDIKVSFPPEYGAPNLAGKTADFAIKLHKIERAALPATNDEAFLKQLNVKDEADLRARLKASIQSDVMKRMRQMREHKIVELLDKSVELELPPQLIEDEAKASRENAIAQYGKSSQVKLKAEDLPLDLFLTDAASKIKTSLIINQLIEQEKLEATEADADEFLKKNHKDHYEQAKTYYKSNAQQYNRLLMNIVEERVFDFIFSKLQVEEKAVSVEDLLSKGH